MYIGGNIIVHRSEIVSLRELQKVLTVTNPEYTTNARYGSAYATKPDETLCFLKPLDGDMYEVPRNIPMTYLQPKEIKDLRSYGVESTSDFSFTGKLRNYQFEYLADMPDTPDLVMQMGCGTGKTVTSLYCVSKLKTRTIVIVPTLFLANQWRKRINNFLPHVTCVIGKNNYDYSAADIYILNIDRLKAKDYDERFYAYWGCLIMDEGHRYGSSTYQPEIGLFPAFYRICLTATFRRTDGMHQLLAHHFGKVYYMADPFPKARIIPMLTGVDVDVKDFFKRGKLSFSLLDNWISVNGYRNKMLLSLTLNLLAEGRTVLFLSKRRKSLENFHRMFEKRGYRSTLIVGGIPDDKLDDVFEKANASQVIFGISQLAKEGMDIERIDTLVLHHPVKDIEQPLGRIRRIMEGKKEPLCIYPIDEIAPYVAMFRASRKTANGSRIEDYQTFEKITNDRRTLLLEK